MAIVTAFVDAAVAAGKKGNPALVSGGKNLTISGTFEVAASDDDTSVYKLAKLPSNAIPIKCEIYNDAIAAGTDYDLGLYKENGDVEDKELFASALDMSSGAALGSPKDGLATEPALANFGKKIWELLGKALGSKEEGYVLALTANTVGSASGTISYRFEYSLG